MQTHARRLPLLDHDTETGHELIVSVPHPISPAQVHIYQCLLYSPLIARNYSSNKLQCNQEIRQLHLGLRKLKIGTYIAQNPDEVPESERNNPYYPIATATLGTPVFDVVHMFSERSISAVPIINEEGIVVNLYETVDVIVSPHHFSPPFNANHYQRLWFAWEHINHSTSQ